MAFDPKTAKPNPLPGEFDPSTATPDDPSGLGRRLIGDTLVSAGKGVIGLGEAAVGLANLPTFGKAGKALESIGYDPAATKAELDALYSPEQRLANSKVAAADGFVDTLSTMLDNPSTIAHTVVESVPSMLGGGAIGQAARKIAPKLPAWAAGAIGEGSVGAGASAEGIRQQTEDGELTGEQVLAAAGSGAGTGLIGAGGGKLAQKLGLADIDTALAQGGLPAAGNSGNIITRTAKGAAVEGVLQEMPQSAQEQAWQNYALDNPLGDGVGSAAAMGLLTGAGMGGGANIVSGKPADPLVQPTPTADNPAPTPVPRPDPDGGVLSRAANLLPAPGPVLGLPAPDTLYADAAGNVNPTGPNINVDGAVQPSVQGQAWVNPQNNPGSQGGPGMDQQAPTGPLGAAARQVADPLTGEVIELSRAGLNPGLEARVEDAQDAVFTELQRPALADGRQDAYLADSQGNVQAGKLGNVPPANYVQGGRGMDSQAPTIAARQGQPVADDQPAAMPGSLQDMRADAFMADADGNVQAGKLANVPPANYVQGGPGMDQQAPSARTYKGLPAAKKALREASNPEALEVVKVGPQTFAVQVKGMPVESAPAPLPVLQNRDRTTPASITQMREIAASPDYTRLGFSRDFANGAPVVEPGANVPPARLGRTDIAATANGRKIPVQYAVVEADELLPSHDVNGSMVAGYEAGVPGKSRAIAGNGRVAGISHAYRQGSAGQYRQAIEGDDLHGINPAAIQGMKNPVLVRIMPQEEVTQGIGDESNTTGVSALSGAEQAMNDSRRISIDDMEFSASGEISETTVRQFVQSMPKAEQGGLLDGSRPSRQAYDRAESAIFANAYESESLIRLQAQATDPEVRTVLSGLLVAAPKMARLKGAGAWDIRGLVVEAAEAAVNARRNGQTLEQFAQQIDLDRNPESQYFIELFAGNIRSAKRIGDELSAVAELFYAEASKADTDMFGAVPRRPRQELLNGAANVETDRSPADAQTAGNQAGPGAAAPGREGRDPERAERAGTATDAQPGTEGEVAAPSGAVTDAQPAKKKRHRDDPPVELPESAYRDDDEAGDFDLTSYSEEELAAQAAAQAEADATAAAEAKAATDKAQADRDRNDFVLSGSDRPADVAASRGQNDLFGPKTRGERKAEQAQPEWAQFPEGSGTLGIPRAEMPQIKAEHRGAMVNFLNARDIEHTELSLPATDLKPTQAEFSPKKVEAAKSFAGGDRSILTSSDGHVLDGHHQWLAKREAGEEVKVIRLDAPIRQLLETVAEFPSATTDQSSAAPPGEAESISPETKAAELDAQAFISAPDGSLDFGEITPEMAKAAGRQAGTPHRGIEQEGFTLNKIGTGEGAQVYGWGMYFSSQREVAEHYRQSLSEGVRFKGKPLPAKEYMVGNGVSPKDYAIMEMGRVLVRERARFGLAGSVVPGISFEDAKKEVRASMEHAIKFATSAPRDKGMQQLAKDSKAAISEIDKMQESDFQATGQVYSLDLPVEDSDLLDWDRPLSEQPEKVRDAVKRIERSVPKEMRWMLDGVTPETMGSELYGALGDIAAELNPDGVDNVQQAASELLLMHSIPGLRYLDGNSRSDGEGSHNYVIWDDALLTPEAAQIEALYRLSDTDTKGVPLFSARAIAKKVMAATGLNATVVNTEADLPADLQAQIKRDKATGRVAGVYHNGTAYLVASNLRDTKHAISVMLHEAIGHGGVKSVLGDRIGKVMAEIYRDMPAAMRKELERRYAGQMASMSEADARVMIAEEYVAHLAETDPRHSIINRLVALLRQFIRDTFGKSAALKWTRNDLVLLLAEARTAARNGGRGPGGAARMRETAAADALAALPEVDAADESAFVASLKGDGATRSFASALYKARGTESPFFKAWFGKSRMVDKQGQPIAFVHRSYGERDTFTDADLGKNTGTPTAALGHFLARKDVGNVERYGPVVEQFYIRMEKPKVITQAQFEAMGDWSLNKVQAYRKTLMEQGHDGLYIQGLSWPVVFEGKNIKAKRNQGTFDATASARYSLAQTATAAFKRWFGDSKVVDENGSPRVVYHGTAADFDAFAPSKAKDKEGRRMGLGWGQGKFYFAETGEAASSSASFAQATGRGKQQNVMPVYLAVQKPMAAADYMAMVQAEVEKGKARDQAIAAVDRAIRRDGYDGIIDSESGGIAVFRPEQIKSATGNNGNFDPANADIRYSLMSDAADLFTRFGQRPADPNDPFAEENRRLREQDKSLWDKAKREFRRQFAPGGLLPDAVFGEKVKRDSEFQAVEFDVRHLARGLERAIKADFGVAIDDLPAEQMKRLADALAGKVDPTLPEDTKVAVVAMRQYIDSLSAEYIGILQQQVRDNLKGADAALIEKITGNIGSYVHRSYQAFDDPKWFQKVPTEVVNAARHYLAKGYMEQGDSKKEAYERAEVKVNEMLKTGTAYDSMESFIAEGKLGAKDLSVLIKRKSIAPEIRALLGEYSDPRLNFAKSATKMGRLIWNQRFLDRVREDGLGVFLFEGKDRPAGATVQIAGEASDTYAPLNGLWTFPDVAQAFKDSLGKEQMSDLYRTIVRLNGMVKYGKTVLSPTTAMRNWQSAMFFSLANGHFDLIQMKRSWAALREQVTQNATGDDLTYLRKLKQLGVVYDTPYAGEMMALLNDARMDELLSGKSGAGIKWLRKINEVAQGFYSFGDDFWKIIGFENEKASLIKAGIPADQAEQMAAERIRNTYPTYSMVGKGINWLRRFPLAGTFVSFPAEIIRTSVNMLQLTAADLKSDNPGLQAIGRKRVAGIAMVSAGFYALAAMTAAAFGVGDDEEEAIRDLAAPWQRNSTFLYTGRDADGKLRYFDMSFLDPYGYWKRPLTAMLRDQPWEKAAASGIGDMLSPFLGTDIAAGAIFEVLANKKASGGQVYQESAGAVDQTTAIADHLRKALQPGFVSNAERLLLAGQGARREGSGQPYEMRDEVVSLLGWRASTLDTQTALYYRSFEFTDGLRDASKVLSRTLRSSNKVSDGDIRSARETAQTQYDQAFKEMGRLVNSARAAGMSNQQIAQTLKLSGVSQVNVMALLAGRVPPMNAATLQGQVKAVQQARLMQGSEHAQEIARRFAEARQL